MNRRPTPRSMTGCGRTWTCVLAVIVAIFGTACVEARPPAMGTGIYAIEARIEFDSIDGASFDAATRTLTLFGRRTRTDRRVAFLDHLDHLANALETDAATVSLPWTAASMEAVANEKADLKVFDGERRLNTFGAWLFRAGGSRRRPG